MCINLSIFASAVPEISLGVQKSGSRDLDHALKGPKITKEDTGNQRPRKVKKSGGQREGAHGERGSASL